MNKQLWNYFIIFRSIQIRLIDCETTQKVQIWHVRQTPVSAVPFTRHSFLQSYCRIVSHVHIAKKKTVDIVSVVFNATLENAYRIYGEKRTHTPNHTHTPSMNSYFAAINFESISTRRDRKQKKKYKTPAFRQHFHLFKIQYTVFRTVFVHWHSRIRFVREDVLNFACSSMNFVCAVYSSRYFYEQRR